AVFDKHATTRAAKPRGRRASHGRGRAIEPACGSGRLMIEMARRGFDVEGFDLSQGMLELARRRIAEAGVDAEVRHDSMARFTRRQKFDLAWNLVSTFRLLDNEADARSHLRCVADVLKRGGIYVLGLHMTEYHDRSQHHERWVAERHGTRVVCNIRSWPADRATRQEPCRARITATHADGTVRRLETRWAFRTYSPAQLRALLQSEPRLELVETYGFEHDPHTPIALARDRLDAVLVLRRAS
ncbi:MAG: class I SAM-dependent methyltransferase, partial [Phycisphaeraceae bacterium]